MTLGGDVSLITFSDSRVNLTGVDVSYKAVPMYEMGFKGVELLIEKIKNPTLTQPPVGLAMKFIQGTTTPEVGNQR